MLGAGAELPPGAGAAISLELACTLIGARPGAEAGGDCAVAPARVDVAVAVAPGRAGVFA